MRRQVARLATGSIAVHSCTSSKVRPHPLQIESPWLVEQIAMQGVSGVVWYQAIQASQASGDIASGETSCRRSNTIKA